MLIWLALIGIVICMAGIPLAHLEPAQQCHLLDHDWRQCHPRDWCICHRCGAHEYFSTQDPDCRPTVPSRFRQWRWERIWWPLGRFRADCSNAFGEIVRHLVRCRDCGNRPCDCIPF